MRSYTQGVLARVAGAAASSVELRVTGLQCRKGFHYEEILQLGLRFDADSGRADGSAERGDLC